MFRKEQIKKSKFFKLNQSRQLKEHTLHHTKHAALSLSHLSWKRAFHSMHRSHSRNSNHQSPHKVGQSYSSFPAPFSQCLDLFRSLTNSERATEVQFIMRKRRGAIAFDRCLVKALSPGWNDLLTQNERLRLLYGSQTIPNFCFLTGFLNPD